MDTLFKVNFNWGFYILLLLFFRIVFPGMSWWSFAALAVTFHQFLLLFYSIGSVLPIRYLAGSFMCLQMLLGPLNAYNGADDYITNPVYLMKIPEAEYFIYVLPAVICFIIGLHSFAGRLKGEVLNVKEIAQFVDKSGNIPYIFVGIGFLATYVAGFFGSELGFVFYLLSNFKFIGAFMLLLGTKQLKPWILALVFGSIIISSLQKAMFHDLLTWLIMLGAVIGLKYKPSLILKASAAFGFILLAILIQQVKGVYREAAWDGARGGAGWRSFEAAVTEKSDENALFSLDALGKANLRINQGFIVTNIMSHVPENEPFANGEELYQILEAAFLPRIIAPNKLNAGDRFFFMKYSGMTIKEGTSMGLSAVGDGYINFGRIGGCIFMFVWGLLFSIVLNGFEKFSKTFPFILLFTPLVFYYPIRPDCELQTAMGHLVKSCFLLYMMVIFWKKDLSKILSKKSPAATNVPA